MTVNERLIENYRAYYLRPFDILIAALAFLVAAVTYTLTMTPSVSAGDNGELTTAMFYLGIAHAPGYPLHSFMGKLATFIPINNVGWRSNFFSVLCGALTIYFSVLVYIKIMMSFGSKKLYAYLSGILGGLAFMFSDTLWSQAVMCEVYTISAIFYPVFTLLFLKWQDSIIEHKDDLTPHFGERFLMGFAFLFGVAMAGHQTVLGFAPFATFFIVYVLFTFMLKHRKLENEQFFFGLLLIGYLIAMQGIAWWFYVTKIMSLTSNLYIKENVTGGLGWFIAFNVFSAFPYLYYKIVAPEKVNPHNYFQKGYFVIIKMLLIYYLGWTIEMYMFIRSHGSPPINWMGISEAKQVWLKFGKLFNCIHRKQYGEMGKLAPTLHNRIIQFGLLWDGIHLKQFSAPLYVVGLAGAVQLFRKYKLWLIALLFLLITFNFFLTLDLRYDFENRTMFFVSVFYIISFYTVSIFITMGFHFIFDMLDKLTSLFFRSPKDITSSYGSQGTDNRF